MGFHLHVSVLLVGALATSLSLQGERVKRQVIVAKCFGNDTRPRGLECTSNDQCPTSKSCILGRCGDPCESLCGENSYCTVLHHIPACACKDGHTGNPFIGCTLQVSSTCQPSTNSQSVISGKSGKKVYQIVNSHKASWHEALMFCLRNNTRLASIESIEEYGELTHLIRHHGQFTTDYWTSGSDAGYESYFVWASTGRHFSAKSEMWRPGDPNNWNNTEHCVSFEDTSVNEYGLNDNDCSNKEYFLCEYFE